MGGLLDFTILVRFEEKRMPDGRKIGNIDGFQVSMTLYVQATLFILPLSWLSRVILYILVGW